MSCLGARRRWLRHCCLAPCTILAGCYGTEFSRGTGPYAVGKYPFEAIVIDIGFMAQVRVDGRNAGTAPQDGPNLFWWGLVSLPIDTVVDVALAPVDVIAWIFGCDKAWESAAARARWERDEPGLDPR